MSIFTRFYHQQACTLLGGQPAQLGTGFADQHASPGLLQSYGGRQGAGGSLAVARQRLRHLRSQRVRHGHDVAGRVHHGDGQAHDRHDGGWLRWMQIAPPAAPSTSMTSEPPALDVDRLLTTLDRHEVDFVLVGGVAAIAYGARRPTADVDCVARRSTGNLDRLAAALRSLNARLRVHGLPDEEAALLPARIDNDTLGGWRSPRGVPTPATSTC